MGSTLPQAAMNPAGGTCEVSCLGPRLVAGGVGLGLHLGRDSVSSVPPGLGWESLPWRGSSRVKSAVATRKPSLGRVAVGCID